LPGYGIGDAEELPASWPRALLGGAAFIFLNGVLLRTLHHWAGIPYQLDAMFRSDLAQASLSIFWTVLALAAMLWAHRRGCAYSGFPGRGLMAAVVVKLFLVDMAKVGGIDAIVSFIAVGVLMLVIGYFAPLAVPPKKTGGYVKLESAVEPQSTENMEKKPFFVQTGPTHSYLGSIDVATARIVVSL